MGKRSSNVRNSSTPKRKKPSTVSESTFNSTANTTANSSYVASFHEELETNEIVGRLRSPDEKERFYYVDLLAKEFANEDSNILDEHPSLWTDFLSRFNDVSREIRFLLIQSCIEIFHKRPELRNDIIEAFIQRSRDPDDDIRCESIGAITSIVKTDYSFLTDQLLDVLKERTLDKKAKVRHEALRTLASYYKRATTENLEKERKRLDWIKNKILHVYYQCGLEDKLLCEKLTYTTLVPYALDLDQRMDILFDLYCSIDDNAVKALNEIFKQHSIIRRLARVVLKLRAREQYDKDKEDESSRLSKEPFETNEEDVAVKIKSLAERFINPAKSAEQLKELYDFLATDHEAFRLVEYILGDDFNNDDVQVAIKELFQKVGPNCNLSHLNAITRALMERCAPIIVDADGIRILVDKAMSVLRSEISVDGVPPELLTERTFNLLLLLSGSLPHAFQNEDVMRSLLYFLQQGNMIAGRIALQILSACSRSIPGFFSEDVGDAFLPDVRNLAINAPSKYAKYATVCLAAMEQKVTILRDLVEIMGDDLNMANPRIEANLAVLTVVAMQAPMEFQAELRKMAVAVVKDIVLADDNEEAAAAPDDENREWRPVDELPGHTRAKVAAIKFLSRWLVGQKNNDQSIGTKTIKLLAAILDQHGDVKSSGRLGYAEKAALRLASAKGLLKVLQQKVFVVQLTMPQFRILARTIIDDCRYVRERFAVKLQKALHSLKLPLEFMAIYCLAPRLRSLQDEDGQKAVDSFKRRMQSYLTENIACRREFLLKNPSFQSRPQEFLPEYYVCYVVHILSHLENFHTHDDLEGLQDIKECISFAIEPLLGNASQNNGNQQFLYNMLKDIKNTRNAENPEDEEQNKKMWAVCDLAMVQLSRRAPNLGTQDETYPKLLPFKCFSSPLKSMNNTDVYLRKEFLPKKAEKSFDKSSDKSFR